MADEEIDVEHLAELREAAQKAYAWQEYVSDQDLEERHEGQAQWEYEAAMVALEGALEQYGLRVSEDLDAPGDDWFEAIVPASRDGREVASTSSAWHQEFLGSEQPSREGPDRSR